MTPLDAAIAAACEAGDLLLSYFGKLDPSQVEEKSRNDVVSRADRESEALVSRILLGHFPGDRFLGEETGMSGVNESAPSWIVDPLDGTANFVRGFPHWAVSIARTRGGLLGALEVGVIWDPVKRDLFAGESGSGAFRNGQRMRMPPRAGFDGASLATGFPFRQQHKIDVYLRVFREVFLRCQSLRRAGSAALDLAYVAAGRVDGFWEIGLSPWDTAAGTLLITEAGGRIGTLTGQPYTQGGHVVAGTPKVFDELVACIGPHVPAILRDA